MEVKGEGGHDISAQLRDGEDEAQENIQDLKKEINFYSRLLMEKMLVKKRRIMLKQESKEVQVNWSLIEKYLVGLNMNGKDEQEKTSNLQTQHQGAGRQTSFPATVLSKKQVKKEEEKLTTELQLITQERNEVMDRLISITEEAVNKRPFEKPNLMYGTIQLKEIMSFLHNLEMEKIEAQENIQELKKEINFYTNLKSRLLMEKTLVQKRLLTLRQESKEVHVDWALIEKYLVKLNVNGEDEQEKTSNLQTQPQVSDPLARAEISKAQDEGLLQKEMPPQELWDHSMKQSAAWLKQCCTGDPEEHSTKDGICDPCLQTVESSTP
ncbi:Spermatogenesis-associated glutamate (E)-rich protein 4D [Apodemus speciosus]|uniref:Spermatogenesis-associated glutamate (E)-rich protein 4D n=1 Tax=Apodemus speciosus TaxID=105296 RepID=A0ABQ0FVS1_APOSI